MFVKHVSDKGLEHRAYPELSKFNNKEIIQLKMSKRFEVTFPQGRYTNVKYMKDA
jgi:hypothetical protein